MLDICDHPFFFVILIDGLVCDYALTFIPEAEFQRLGDFFRFCCAFHVSDHFFPFAFFSSSVKN